MKNIAPIVRIGLRIFGGFMIGRGYISSDSLWIFSDEEVIGLLSIGLSEGWYLLSKRYGWAT